MTKIEWTDVTKIVDRHGKRVRYYRKKKAARPGTQERRQRFAFGQRWCRGCEAWRPVAAVGKQGVCKKCANAEYRRHYATNPHAIRARNHGRARGVEAIPPEAALVAEIFDDRCAYCGGPRETWDHIIPVSKGGVTEPGNIVPACRRCNSSKRDSDLCAWLQRKRLSPRKLLEYAAFAGAFDDLN